MVLLSYFCYKIMVACSYYNLTPIKMLKCSDYSLYILLKEGFTKTLPRSEFIGGLAKTFIDHELQDILSQSWNLAFCVQRAV